MGVEQFFSTVNRNFNVVNNISLENNESAIITSYLLFDFNSIIHDTSAILLDELNKNSKKNYNNDEIELLIIERVNDFIINVLNKLDLSKLKLMYIALDGTPSLSKMLEQKKRRFIGDFQSQLLEPYKSTFSWSKNNISPGTLFMNKITKFLSNIKSVINKEKIKENDLILDLDKYNFYNKINKFEYSDTNAPGEAEMKILDLMVDLPNEPIIFYSPDSDVILLSLISIKSTYITILKFDRNIQGLSMINIELFKQSIYNYCYERLNKKLDIINLINDIVFIFTIFGNDFIPRCEAINTSQDFLFLIDLYLIIYIDNGNIIINNKISNQPFFNFLSLLKKHEKRLLIRTAKRNSYQNYTWANQQNFYIDLLKFKKSQKTSNTFYDNILFYIEPGKMKDILNKTKYGCLEFYLMKKKDVYKTLKKELEKELPINTSFIIDISEININSYYDKFREQQYVSTIKKHVNNMADLTPRQKEEYLINNKLDKYSKIFNPYSGFYKNIITLNKINKTIYYNKNFPNIKKKKIVDEYLNGFKWVAQYYFDRKNHIDETWYYPYHKPPLIKTIIKYYKPISDKPFQININKITPIEQLLYITPIRISDMSKDKPNVFKLFTDYKDEKLINKIKLFVKNNPQFFYDLDKIYDGIKTGTLPENLFDCSNAAYISKCHYDILNEIIDLKQFVKTFRET